MKKSLLNLGTVLSKSQQKEIQGGRGVFTTEGDECASNGNGSPNGCHCAYDNQCASGNCELSNGPYSGFCM